MVHTRPMVSLWDRRLGLQCGLGRASPKLVPLLACESVLFLLQEALERPSWPSASMRPSGSLRTSDTLSEYFFFFFGDMNAHHCRCEESEAVAGPRAVLSHEEGPVHL